MKRQSLALAISVLSAAAAADEYLDPKGLGFDPFVPFGAIPQSELYPKAAKFSVSKEGHLLVNGQPHYFTATIWYGSTELECNEDTPGYVPELKWLYQEMPGYDNLQRLGLDGIGYEAPMDWFHKFNPDQKVRRRDDKKYAGAIASGLPLYVDFTASTWSHGALWLKDKKAKAPGGHHFMPYSIVTEEGRNIWKTMWTEGAKDTIAMGWKPWCYELFNEPACSEEGRAPENLKGADRIKFVEEKFSSLLKEGQEALRKVDPDALACFQPTTMRTRGIDLYEANRHLKVVCAPTGGHGGAVEAHLLRALADGKPIVDSEMYVGCSTNSIRQSFLDQYQRGYNVSYMFKWSRRPCDWRVAHEVVETEGKWKGAKFWRMWPEESLKKVGKVSAYNFLCPYKVATDQLLGIRIAKREIQDVNEFFTPRDRGIPRKVAVLFSQTNERHAFACGGGNNRLFDALVQALDYAHLPIDVIFEPQITETDRLNRYDVLTFAGVSKMDPTTRRRIDEWAAKGGSLVEFKEKVPMSEMVSAVLAAAAKKGVKPCCEMLDAIKDDGTPANSIEVTPARRGKLDAYMITSRAPTLPVVRFKPAPLAGAKKPVLVRLSTRPGTEAVEGADPRVRNLVTHRQPLRPDANGYYTLVLNGGSHFYVYGGTADVLAKYPRTKDVVWDAGLTAEQGLAFGKAEIEREKAERAARMPVFDVDPNRMVFVRLNEFANIQNPGFKIPWGVTDWRGMRFDFVRFDQNQFKDVIKVDKPVKGIAVDSRAAYVYFAHTAAPAYRVFYDDGTAVDVDKKSGQEVVGWKDSEGHKYMIRQWPNPKPEKKISSIAIAPRRGTTSYVAAITVQKPEPKTVVFPKFGRSGGGKGVHASYDKATRTWNVALDETAGSWCCGNADLAEGIPVEPGKYCRLYFEMNRLPDADGNYHDHATPQLKLNGRDENGKLAFGGWRVPMHKRGGWAYRTDSDPETWETVWIGIDKGTVPDHFRKIISVAVQFQMMPAEHSGLAFRNFRLEEAE